MLAEFNQEIVIFVIFILKIFLFLFFSIVIILHEVLIDELVHAVWVRYLRLVECVSRRVVVHARTNDSPHFLACRLGLLDVTTSDYFLHAGSFDMRDGE